jgi:hypothetical protein
MPKQVLVAASFSFWVLHQGKSSDWSCRRNNLLRTACWKVARSELARTAYRFLFSTQTAAQTTVLRLNSTVHDLTKVNGSRFVTGETLPGRYSRLDPRLTCSRRFLAGRNARSSLGLRAHRQPDKPVQRLGTLSCLRLELLFSSTSALL